MNRTMKVSEVLLLAGAGAASFYLATHWLRAPAEAPDASDLVVEPVVARERPAAASGTNTNVTTLERDATLKLPDRSHGVPESKGDPFVTLNWLPPVAPAPALAAPPPPQPAAPVAPPLPFAFVGMLERGAAQPQAFLAKGEALLVVAAGDTLDNNTYRVESLSPQQIVITYLPMNTRQTLNVLGATQ
jgi:hypothetical protein